jgi:O-antigen ligase
VLPLLVGALLCIGAFILIFLRGKDNMELDKLCKLIWILLAVAILLAVIFIYVYPFESGLLYEVHEILHGRAQDSFGTSRIYIWRNVLEKLPDHLIFGTGPDTMKEALGLKFYRYGENGEVIKTVSIDTAHNEYLNMLSNQGLFATLCYLGALGYSVYLWIKYRKNDGVCICGSAMLAYCVQSFFGFSMFITAPSFWIVWAGLLYFADKEEEKA